MKERRALHTGLKLRCLSGSGSDPIVGTFGAGISNGLSPFKDRIFFHCCAG
jgi:hypothetical protein